MFDHTIESYMDPVVLDVCNTVILALQELNISTQLRDYRWQSMTRNLYYKNQEIGMISIQYYESSPSKTFLTFQSSFLKNRVLTFKSYGTHKNLKSYFTRLLNSSYFVAPVMVLAWRKGLIYQVPKEILLYIFEYVWPFIKRSEKQTEKQNEKQEDQSKSNEQITIDLPSNFTDLDRIIKKVYRDIKK